MGFCRTKWGRVAEIDVSEFLSGFYKGNDRTYLFGDFLLVFVWARTEESLLGFYRGHDIWGFSSFFRLLGHDKARFAGWSSSGHEQRNLFRASTEGTTFGDFLSFFGLLGHDTAHFIPGNITNPLGSNVTTVNVNNLLGLNTLGISLHLALTLQPYGLNPPHTHPRATEILVVIEGTLYVGFVTSNTDNRLCTKVLNKGDVFVSPIGLIHFQLNVRKTNAVAFVDPSSQNIGSLP
ncbi:Germin-like protein subfamily 1 member 14 [Morella rubra]|uniref:Germin-like protein n=1 Tax=Morella rubra TaxID=262757 RepID=A0A6A1WNQ7_9ROSI|nr:Germin-like protein subfamily 1 member 14 [Morella rubra]